MRVLVVFGSTRGGTMGLAQMVANGLRDEGLTAEVLPAGRARGLGGCDAVVVGGAIYAMRWHRAARRFVRKHAAALRQRPTYFFSSGPLDDSAARKEVPPLPSVKALMDHVGARGHVTFGGRLEPHTRGLLAGVIATEQAGDWRDPVQVRDWARTLAAQLRAEARSAA